MDHALLVARLVIAERVGGVGADLRLERLTQARHVAVPKDAEDARDESGALPVPLDVLRAEAGDQRLGRRQPSRASHVRASSSSMVIGRVEG